ncbi:MAG: putative ABC transporter permease [Clostridium sp.]
MNRYIILFFIFSLLGWIWESIYCTLNQQKWANRGFLYGPICPIYGFGGIFGLYIYDLITKGTILNLEWYNIFIVGFLVSMILEYPTSLILEKLFHARWWDYSYLPLNINGRISVPSSVLFGIGSIIIMKVLIPFFNNILNTFPNTLLNLIPIILISVISIDLTLTITALTDLRKRLKTVDDNVQQYLTNMVENLYNTPNYFHKHALKRIAKLTNKKKNIKEKEKE